MPDVKPISITMSVSASGVEASVVEASVVEASVVEASVVELSDGRLGFMARPDGWPGDHVDVVLTAGDRRVRGSTTVVRSGSAYEEVRGRLRAEAGILGRWRLRRDRPVVLVLVAGTGPST